ncbi:B-cell receptor CD22 isoform X2 [Ctenopharyngodon idella]|uniref:B-cell receptor CD22 isoform X2 n=1 Tax=Ctenopharyngodon idella TaxID=7959 RepID=UPI00222FB043|nr:B-cell receptor CD22 isoform X2 [Ctenopharyngodon idella]
MFLEGILLLLFVILTSSFTGSLEVLIKVQKNTETTMEGSSVTIPCVYLHKEDNLKLLWFKDSKFDDNTKLFNGTIVYSNTKERPPSPEYSNRVEYITDITSTSMTENKWIQCNLRITDLQTTDSGNYSFRLIGSKKENKYMSTAMNLIVKGNPCKVHTEASEPKNPLKELEEYTVNCFTFASCPDHPEWLIYTSGQNQEWMSSSLTDMIIKTEEEDGGKVTKLKLNVTWKDDERILSCRPANDQDSSQIRNITLSVEYGPKETTAKVSSEDVKEGESVTLSCTSRGHPNVTFLWFKKEKVEMSQMSDFKLNNVNPEDSGNYYCEAKNEHGKMESNIITIDVKYGPKDVTVEPPIGVADFKEGDKLELSCSVKKSNPEVKQFTWYNNNNLLQQTSKILSISSVTADDSGFYHCCADNGIKSEKSNEILVSVKYSPRNINIQGSYTVKVYSRLSLTCSADADPQPIEYAWKHTPGLTSFPLESQTGQLNIDNVTIQHAGQYTCDVTNTIGTRSHTINVDVLYPPSNLSLIMKSEVREFEVFSIICTVQSFPLSDLTMTEPQYDLINIQNNRRNITKSANKLTVYFNVTESDAGMYKCKAENSEGNLESHQQELTVFYAPKNVTTSSKGEQTFGGELTLTCEARSKPAASYEWKKSFNGQLKTVGHEQKLYFRSLSISDSGQFVCIVKNSIGENKSQSVDIRVKYTPNINIVHNQTEWNWELPVYLTCSADAYPPASHYKWYREEDNTTLLSDQQNFTVQPQNPGMYYCTAANSVGNSRSEHIKLFVSNPIEMLYQIILPIILLLILIAVAIFLIRRTINKGSQNNTQENLSMEDIPDPIHGRVNQSHPTPHSQEPTQAQDLNPRTKSNIHTVYSAIELPPMKLGKRSPKSQKPGYTDNGLDTSTLNYVTLDFKEQNDAKRAPEDSAVYAMVSKNKQSKNSQSEHNDYENVSSACASRLPFNNIDWESDTSEEDEVNYTTVSCSTKLAVKEPRHNQRSHLGSSSSDDEERTEYSAIKT